MPVSNPNNAAQRAGLVPRRHTARLHQPAALKPVWHRGTMQMLVRPAQPGGTYAVHKVSLATTVAERLASGALKQARQRLLGVLTASTLAGAGAGYLLSGGAMGVLTASGFGLLAALGVLSMRRVADLRDVWSVRLWPTPVLGTWTAEFSCAEPSEVVRAVVFLADPGVRVEDIVTPRMRTHTEAPPTGDGTSVTLTLPAVPAAAPGTHAEGMTIPFWGLGALTRVRGRRNCPTWDVHGVLEGPAAAYAAHLASGAPEDAQACTVCGHPWSGQGDCPACGARFVAGPDADAWLERVYDISRDARQALAAEGVPDMHCVGCGQRTRRVDIQDVPHGLCGGCGGIMLTAAATKGLHQAGL